MISTAQFWLMYICIRASFTLHVADTLLLITEKVFSSIKKQILSQNLYPIDESAVFH